MSRKITLAKWCGANDAAAAAAAVIDGRMLYEHKLELAPLNKQFDKHSGKFYSNCEWEKVNNQ